MITSKRQQASKVRHERKRALLTKKRNYVYASQSTQQRRNLRLDALYKAKAV